VINSDVKLSEMAFPVRTAKTGRNKINFTPAPSIRVCMSHCFFFDFFLSEKIKNKVKSMTRCLKKKPDVLSKVGQIKS